MTPFQGYTPYWLHDEEPREFKFLATGSSPDIDAIGVLELTKDVRIDNSANDQSRKRSSTQLIAQLRPRQAWTIFTDVFPTAQAHSIDLIVMPAKELPFKLLMCDMDGTILVGETLDDLARRVGCGDEITAITDRAMRGELEFREALSERLLRLAGVSVDNAIDVARTAVISKGAEKLVQTANEAGIRTVLVSGGFTPMVEEVARRLNFSSFICNELDVQNGQLTGRLCEPVIDAAAKADALKNECAALGVRATDALCIGDGANDLPMLRAAGLGIAYRAKPVVTLQIPWQINSTDLITAVAALGAA